MNILVLNSGSSSLKFQLIASDLDRIKQNADERLCKGRGGRIGGAAIVTAQVETQPRPLFTAPLADLGGALDFLVRWMASEPSGLSAVQNAADIHAARARVCARGETVVG